MFSDYFVEFEMNLKRELEEILDMVRCKWVMLRVVRWDLE